MDLIKVADDSVRIFKKNSPKILLITGIGLGAVAIAGSGLASFKAYEVIDDIHKDPRIRSKKDLAKAYLTKVIPLYIPVAIAEAGSVICLVKSYDINAKRLAAATAIAEVSVETLNMFKRKAEKELGEKRIKELEKEVLEEQQKKDEEKRESSDSKDINIKDTDVIWFHDTLTGQEFVSTITNITRANCKFLERMNAEMFMSKNEWLDILKEYTFNANDGEYQVHTVPDGDDVGWFRGETVHVYTEKVKKNDRGIPSIYLEYSSRPEPRFSDKLGQLHRW